MAGLLCALMLVGAGTAAAEGARVSLPVIERQVMCVTCKIPLNVAESPQASRERDYIRSLIAEGKDEAQIKDALVSQYTSAVLGLPQTHGFDLAAYLVPVAVVIGLLALLFFLLPSWRRRSAAGPGDGGGPISPEDAARLESDLALFD
jgi:cytochrome c-type biogenesis protein CcmH/NrfF